MIKVNYIKAFDDNYIWIIENPVTKYCVVVDPGDEDPVNKYLENNNIQLESILITHKHPDHVGGVDILKQKPGVTVYGPKNEATQWSDVQLVENDIVELNKTGFTVNVIDVPGHTHGHIAYLCVDMLFCGDTLFAGGCGRVFEGTMSQMYNSLMKLATLPGSTRVYCAHEYTLANLDFALAVEPNNIELQQFMASARATRSKGMSTIPTNIAQEKETNPFLRCQQAGVIQAAEKRSGQSLSDPVAVFTSIREWKNSF